MSKSRDADKFVVRLPDGMRERIAERAAENGRSMNSEVVRMLHAGMDSGQALSDTAQQLISAVRAELSGDTLPPGVVELSLRGQPGSGKSTLMVILGEHLQKVLDEHAAKRGWHPAKVLYAFKETTAHGIAHACVNHARVVLLREEA